MKIISNPTLNQNSNQLELKLDSHGYAEIDSGWNATNVRSLYSRLYLVLSGQGKLRYRGQEFIIAPGTVTLVPAGTIFDFGSLDHLKKLFFHISLDLPTGYDLLSKHPGIYLLPIEEETTREFERLYRQESLPSAFRLKEQLTAQICRFLEEFHLCDDSIPAVSPLIADTMRYIQDNLTIQLNIPQLAERAFISKSKLTKQFRQEVGVSISHYIDDFLFRFAEYQLIYTDQSLKQISDSLGFCDQFYFSRRFHARYGEPPLSYWKRQKDALLFRPT